MLEVRGLAASINDKPILRGIDLTVPQGEVHAIMGPNGSGKSTLAYVLSGRADYEVTAGGATFDGQDLLAMDPEARAAAEVARVQGRGRNSRCEPRPRCGAGLGSVQVDSVREQDRGA